MTEQERRILQADWYATLLRRALQEAATVEEAAAAADMALSIQPYRPGAVALALEIDAMLATGITASGDPIVVGKPFQGKSRRWFVKLESGRVVPSAPPDGTHGEHRWKNRRETSDERGRRALAEARQQQEATQQGAAGQLPAASVETPTPEIVVKAVKELSPQHHGLVPLSILHKIVGGTSEQFKEIIQNLRRAGVLTGTQHESRNGLPDELRQSAIYDSPTQPIHYISLREGVLSIEPATPARKPSHRHDFSAHKANVYRKLHLQGKGIFLAREEAFGSEPPGPGWTSAGEGRWVKTEEPPAKRSRDALRVAVVGGGPGGLFATYLVNQRLPQADVTVFEANDNLGGKILTKTFSNGAVYEAGVAELYEYLGPGGKDPLRLLIEEELNLSTRNMSGGCVILKGEVLHDLDAVEFVHGKHTRKKIERFHRTCADLMPLGKYANRWQPDPSHPWADDTFLNHLLREMEDDQVAADYILAAVHSDLACAPHTCNGLNGIKNVLMDNQEYMQLYHIKGGIGKLAEALEEAIQATVHLNAPVVEVKKRKEKYRVHYLANGRETHDDFDVVVLAMPNHWLSQLRWEHAALRSSMQKLLAHYDLPAHYLRISLLFDHRWWDCLRIEGDYWMIDSCGGACVYDESARWGADEDDGHVLSFLIAGEAALLLCSNNQSDEEVLKHLLRSLPACMALAEEHLVEYSVNRWVGSINAQPGGWLPRELRGQHVPDKKDHPGLFLVADFLFDSTLNAALMSASTAVELLGEHLGVKMEQGGPAAKQLVPEGSTL